LEADPQTARRSRDWRMMSKLLAFPREPCIMQRFWTHLILSKRYMLPLKFPHVYKARQTRGRRICKLVAFLNANENHTVRVSAVCRRHKPPWIVGGQRSSNVVFQVHIIMRVDFELLFPLEFYFEIFFILVFVFLLENRTPHIRLHLRIILVQKQRTCKCVANTHLPEPDNYFYLKPRGHALVFMFRHVALTFMA
jgi:hypothetical protein